MAAIGSHVNGNIQSPSTCVIVITYARSGALLDFYYNSDYKKTFYHLIKDNNTCSNMSLGVCGQHKIKGSKCII